MAFCSVRLCNFRNLEHSEVDLDARTVYLIGENGQGKTNFLEALYFLSYGSSFRTRQEREIIAWGQKDCVLRAQFSARNEGPTGSVAVFLKNGVKTIELFGKRIRDRKELLNQIPVIAFVHGDFLFASGPPERRRWFMDQTLSLHDPLYVDQLRSYKKLLKQRNFLLKNRKISLLDQYSEQLAFCGLALMHRRKRLIQNFGKIFTPLYQCVSDTDLQVQLEYQPSWGALETVEDVCKNLREKQEADLTLGNTSIGPHRDHLMFIVNGRNFIQHASTGQQRLLSLILRTAQACYYTTMTGQKPILLLDDVLLELDPKKRRLFRENLPEAEQVLYTVLPEEPLPKSDDVYVYRIRQGALYREQ